MDFPLKKEYVLMSRCCSRRKRCRTYITSRIGQLRDDWEEGADNGLQMAGQGFAPQELYQGTWANV